MKSMTPAGYRHDGVTLGHFLRLPSYVISGLKFISAGRVYTPKPLVAILSATRRCNSRCITCRYWKDKTGEKELTPGEIGKLFQDPLFSSLKRLTLTGGEATLRDDLIDIARNILAVRPNIREVTLSTNCLDPDRVVGKVSELLALIRSKGISRFSVATSLDGYGELHEVIRRVPRAFERVNETILRLQDLQKDGHFYLSANCVVQPANIDSLEKVAKWGESKGLPVTFSPICVSNVFTESPADAERLKLNGAQINRLKSIFAGELRSSLTASDLPFWQEYFKIAKGARRRLPCFLVDYFVNVDSDGKLRMCAADDSLVYGNGKDEPPDKIWYSEKAKALRKRVRNEFCPGCTIHCDPAFSLTHEFFYYAGFFTREKVRKLLHKGGMG